MRAHAPRPDDTIESCLSALRSGDDVGFTGLYRLLAGRVAGYLRGRGVRDVEDVVNEVFLGAFHGIGSFDGDSAQFRSWIFGIASNKAADWHRTRYRRPTIVDEPDRALRAIQGGDAEVEAVDRIQSAEAVALLAQLSEDQRNVLLLRMIAGLSLRETAEALGKPVGAVKSIQHRALATLKRSISVQAVSDQHVSAITSVR